MACKNSVQSIAEKLANVFKIVIPGAPKIPPQLLSIGGELRPGLNKEIITSRIISSFSQIGLKNGPAPDGSQNVMEGYTALVVDKLVDALCLEAKVDVSMPIASLSIVSNGANAGGPVVSQGTNIMPSSGTAVIQ